MKRATHFCDFLTFCSAISIHALMKRATTVGDKTKAVIADFNPRPHEEGDIAPIPMYFAMFIFQSTPS